MKIDEAIKMAIARITCIDESTKPMSHLCRRSCGECEFNYTQGNMGEQIEWLGMAIEALKYQKEYQKNIQILSSLVEKYSDICVKHQERVQKCIEIINKKIEDCTKGMQEEEHRNDMFSEHVFDGHHNCRIAYCDALKIIKEEMGCDECH